MPPTFLLVLALMGLAVVAPLVLLVIGGLCVYRPSRAFGMQALASGALGSALMFAAWLLLTVTLDAETGVTGKAAAVPAAIGFSLGAMLRLAWTAWRITQTRLRARRQPPPQTR